MDTLTPQSLGPELKSRGMDPALPRLGSFKDLMHPKLPADSRDNTSSLGPKRPLMLGGCDRKPKHGSGLSARPRIKLSQARRPVVGIPKSPRQPPVQQGIGLWRPACCLALCAKQAVDRLWQPTQRVASASGNCRLGSALAHCKGHWSGPLTPCPGRAFSVRSL